MVKDDQPSAQAPTATLANPARAAAASAPPAQPVAPTEHQMDPLQSPALQQELPGLLAAFDEQGMRAALQALLFDPQHPRATIERCEVEQATYVPGECVILRYTLALKREHNGQTEEALVSGRLFPNQPACDAYTYERLLPLVAAASGRAEIAPFDVPVGAITNLHMAVHAWPIDGDLPSLLGATNPQRLMPILSEVLPNLLGSRFTVGSCRVELVDYGRQHRATLRYHLSGTAGASAEPQPLLVYGKLTGDGSGALAESISAALRERVQAGAAEYRFSVPQALPWQPDLKLSLLEALPGKSPISDLLKARLRAKPIAAERLSLEEMIEACAHIAATLHTSGLGLGRRRTFDDELAALRRGVEAAQRISPEFGTYLASHLDRLAHNGAQTDPLPPCFNHGDFTYGQILFDGTHSGLIDFDSIAQAEPALDLGQFLTYIRIASMKSSLGPAATTALIDQLGERFLAVYASAAGGQASDMALLRRRISLYRTISLLRRTIRSWQKFKPGRITGALALLEEEQQRSIF